MAHLEHAEKSPFGRGLVVMVRMRAPRASFTQALMPIAPPRSRLNDWCEEEEQDVLFVLGCEVKTNVTSGADHDTLLWQTWCNSRAGAVL